MISVRNKKRIVFSTYDSIKNPYYSGGGSQAIHEVASKLSQKYDVTIIAGGFPGAKNQTLIGVNYKYVKTSSFGPKIGHLFFHLNLPLLVRTLPFDVWFESFTPPFSTSLLPLFSNKKIVGLVHSLQGSQMEHQYRLPFGKIENFGLQKYTDFVTVSQHLKDQILAINPLAAVSVIPNGVDASYFSYPKQKQGNYILYLGRIEMYQKGIEMLLKIFKSIANRVDCKLILAGQGIPSEMKRLNQFIRDNNLRSRIEYLGQVEGITKKRLISEAKLIAIPSRSESFSITALEALALGTPVVSFAITGLFWIPDKCILKIPPFDQQKFGEAIVNLLRDRSLQRKISKQGKMFSKNFSITKVGKLYDRYIQSILSS